jgi:hypothetical protein
MKLIKAPPSTSKGHVVQKKYSYQPVVLIGSMVQRVQNANVTCGSCGK